MANNILEKYKALGGKIEFRCKVENVEIEEGIVKGVTTKDGFIPADAVIVTQDMRNAIDNLFDKMVALEKRPLLPGVFDFPGMPASLFKHCCYRLFLLATEITVPMMLS